jgi:hypothetical protein
LATENGKTYFTVNDIPFPIFGAQIRLDAFLNGDKKSIEEIEPYFISAKELNVNCLQIPIFWKLIELQQDSFNFKEVDKILEYANKYNLKIELLWFSTNMIGDSFSFLVPEYILENPAKRFKSKYEGNTTGIYGRIYTLIFDDEWILDRETSAVKKLMTHINKWDKANKSLHPVISVQVHNEPDGLARWRCDQMDIRYRENDSLLTQKDAWNRTLRALDVVGRSFKESDYKVVTRTNIITYEGLNDFPQLTGANPIDVFKLEGIDFISYDPYVSSIDLIKSNTLAFNSLYGNYSLIAENKGTYENTASLILTAAALGSGYNIYDLATSKFFIDKASPEHKDEMDHGIYSWDLKEKSHTCEVRSLLKGLTAAYPDVAVCNSEDFAAFNIRSQFPETICSQTIQTTRVRYSFFTSDKALGFALTRDDYLLIYTTKEAEIVLSNGTFSNPVVGKYNNKGTFIEDEDQKSIIDGNILRTKKEILYKIKYNSTSKLQSNTIDYIGTK